ncbi:MAG: hypothetical protein IPP48_13495 [Chitinophagaceae bacterium]|nr:hypothetical protein [Chitinophagaceae bacterium]
MARHEDHRRDRKHITTPGSHKLTHMARHEDSRRDRQRRGLIANTHGKHGISPARQQLKELYKNKRPQKESLKVLKLNSVKA